MKFHYSDGGRSNYFKATNVGIVLLELSVMLQVKTIKKCTKR